MILNQVTAYRSASVVIVVLKYTSNTLNCPEFLDKELFFLYSSDNVNFLAEPIQYLWAQAKKRIIEIRFSRIRGEYREYLTRIRENLNRLAAFAASPYDIEQALRLSLCH